MNVKAKAFWEKSLENRQVSEKAYSDGHFNASASRYYYALRHAAQALFEERNIHPPPFIWRGGRQIPWTEDGWPHPELIKMAATEIIVTGKNIRELFKKAKKARIRGDYHYLPVEPIQFDKIKENSDIIFKVIESELKPGK